MLTIYRKVNNSIYIGNKKMTVEVIGDREVTLKYDNKTFSIKHGTHKTVDNVNVYLLTMMKVEKKIVLGFEGDRSIRIMRGELYEKGSTKYIDNSTKTFPSGGNY